MSRSLQFVALAGVVTALGGAARAEFVTPDAYGWTRTSANSAWFAWDVFPRTVGPAGPFAPDAGTFFTGVGSASLVNTQGGSFVTSGGNLYNITLPLLIGITVPTYAAGPGQTTTVLLQVRTQGTEILPSSVLLGTIAPTSTVELFRQAQAPAPDGSASFLVDTLYRFSVPAGESAGSLGIGFRAALGSMVLDRVTVDTFIVPAPGVGACVALAGLASLRRRR
jgi:hypothetical protein